MKYGWCLDPETKKKIDPKKYHHVKILTDEGFLGT